MIITLNDRYRIVSDNHQWALQLNGSAVAYFTGIPKLLQELARTDDGARLPAPIAAPPLLQHIAQTMADIEAQTKQAPAIPYAPGYRLFINLDWEITADTYQFIVRYKGKPRTFHRTLQAALYSAAAERIRRIPGKDDPSIIKALGVIHQDITLAVEQATKEAVA